MDKEHLEVIEETLFKGKLTNGLEIRMMPRPGFNRQYAIFATDYGSIDNSFINPESGEAVTVPDGIAHFLEHKLFEGEEEDTFSVFARLGASANAFTNYTTTAYLFSSTGEFGQSLINLIDFVQSPYFTDENVEKEKGIIAQEIKMYEDDPDYQVFFNLLQALYHNHPVRIDIGGTVESINKITREDLYLCYNTFYHPVNMVLFLIGNFEAEKIYQLIRQNQAEKDFPSREKVERVFPDEPAKINKKRIKRVMDISQPLYRLGYKEKELELSPGEMIRQELATNMLLELLIGKSSNLYEQLYEDGLVDDDFAFHYTRQPGYGFVVMGGKTRDPEELEKRLLGGLSAPGANGVGVLKEEDFIRIYRKYQGIYLEGFNSFETTAFKFISNFFKGFNYFELLRVIQNIDLEYLKERQAEILQEDRAASSIITPGQTE